VSKPRDTLLTFVAIYRGQTIGSARLIAVSADPALVAEVSSRILHEHPGQDAVDPIIACVDEGRKRALRLITQEDRDE
jgi:hypothetical protein